MARCIDENILPHGKEWTQRAYRANKSLKPLRKLLDGDQKATWIRHYPKGEGPLLFPDNIYSVIGS